MVTSCDDRSRQSTRKNFRSSKLHPKIRRGRGTRRSASRFLVAPRVYPHPPNARSLQSKNRVRPRARFFNLHLSQARNASADGTFGSLVRLDTMSERATTRLIGLSLSGLFLMMLMLNAISS